MGEQIYSSSVQFYLSVSSEISVLTQQKYNYFLLFLCGAWNTGGTWNIKLKRGGLDQVCSPSSYAHRDENMRQMSTAPLERVYQSQCFMYHFWMCTEVLVLQKLCQQDSSYDLHRALLPSHNNINLMSQMELVSWCLLNNNQNIYSPWRIFSPLRDVPCCFHESFFNLAKEMKGDSFRWIQVGLEF